MGPSEQSGDEEHVSSPWGSAGKPPEMGAGELRLQPWPGLDPAEQHSHVVEGSIAGMRYCSASYSRMLRVPNQTTLAKNQAAMARFSSPSPCLLGSSPSDSPQWSVWRQRESNSLTPITAPQPSSQPSPFIPCHSTVTAGCSPVSWGGAPQSRGRRVRIQQLARIKGERNAGKKGQVSVGFGGKALNVVETIKQGEMWRALGREGLR